MEITYKRKKYIVREESCKHRECFVPFSGNNFHICRLYELGNCPKKYQEGNNENT